MTLIKHIAALLMIMLMLTSCATTKKSAMPESAPDKATSQETSGEPFSLPDPDGESKDETLAEGGQATAGTPDMEAVIIEDIEEEEYIILNFENTDIQTILATFGELLKINYILTPGVSGNVTIQSYSRFPTKNLFHIFQSILEINGLTAVKDGDFYRIVPIDTAKTQPMDVLPGQEQEYALDSAFVTKLMPLENVKASEVSNILKELMPRGTNLIVYEPSNLLIVTALPYTLEKFTKIIDNLDVDTLDGGSVRTFVYYVENGEAKKLEAILKTVYLGQQKTESRAGVPDSPTSPVRPARTAAPKSELPGELGDITVSAYEDINALIIKCSPRSFISLLKVLKSIDVAPRQVLIEVMIAEVTLGEENSYGIEWGARLHTGNFYGMNPGRFLQETSGALLPPGEVNISDQAGKFAAISSGTMGNDAYVGLFTALASESNINVLASPNILAMDNKEAEIKIGNEVPTATSTTQSTEGVTTSSQIQYKTVGTILTVTPHITEKGNVSMKILVEKSDIGPSTKIGTGDYPAFITRKATTNALVNNGHTLFLGGLISNKKTRTMSGIPFLSKIPILGYLFGGRTWKEEKTEMFVMVTPRVIASIEEADELTSNFNDRVKIIKEKILKIKEKKIIKTPEKSSVEQEQAASLETPEAAPMSKDANAPAATAEQSAPPAPHIP